MNYAPYSHSKLESFRSCPFKFKLNYIDKVRVPFVTNLALYRGSYMHECIEFSDDRPDFETNEVFTPEEKAKALETVNQYRASEIGKYYYNKHGQHEQEFGLMIDGGKLIATEYNDKRNWLRGKIDYSYWDGDILVICDWKSGKDKSQDTKYFTNDQMVMYAVWAFSKYPELQDVTTSFVYLEHSTERKETFHRENYKEYVKQLFMDTKAAENGERYSKVVGPLCGYCDFKTYGHCSGEIDNDEIMKFGGLDF